MADTGILLHDIPGFTDMAIGCDKNDFTRRSQWIRKTGSCNIAQNKSTNIFSAYPVAKKILALNIDERLTVGDLSLVNDIAAVQMANGTEKNFYSFATKYCSHHQPKKYAIYDSYVDKILRYFRSRDRFAQFADSDLKNYPRFNAVLNQFRKFYKLEDYDLKLTDRYLWQLGKAAFPKEYK